MWLFIAFLAVPLIEIALFIQVGGLIGLMPTLAVVIITAILGTWLVRSQGRAALNDLRGSFSQLDDPSEPLAHGAMILFSGALLLTPGFFTDAVGFALLVPPIRRAIINYAKTRINIQRMQMGPDSNNRHPKQRNANIIDGEFVEIPPKNPDSSGPSGWTNH